MKTLISLFRWTLAFAIFIPAAITLIFFSFLPFEEFRFTVARNISRAILWGMGAKLKLEGEFPKGGPYLYMSNHASLIDMFVMAAVTPGKFTGVVAQYQMNYPLWGWMLRRMKAVPVFRKQREQAIESINIAGKRINDGYHVGILPEGTRTLTGKLQRLKSGAFYMAKNTGAPIIVIGVEGGFSLKSKLSWHITPGPIYVRFGDPILPEDIEKMSRDELKEMVNEQLLLLSGEKAADET